MQQSDFSEARMPPFSKTISRLAGYQESNRAIPRQFRTSLKKSCAFGTSPKETNLSLNHRLREKAFRRHSRQFPPFAYVRERSGVCGECYGGVDGTPLGSCVHEYGYGWDEGKYNFSRKCNHHGRFHLRTSSCWRFSDPRLLRIGALPVFFRNAGNPSDRETV